MEMIHWHLADDTRGDQERILNEEDKGRNCQRKDSIHEEVTILATLESDFIRFGYLDAAKDRGKLSEEFWDVVLEEMKKMK